MACETHCCVLTRGEFFLSDWKGSCLGGLPDIVCSNQPRAFKKLGNISSCLVQIDTDVLGTENEFNLLDETCARVMMRNVRITLTLECASKENLYRALWGEQPAADANNRIQDFCISSLSECDFFPFDRQAADLPSVDVYLRNAEGDLVATLILDVDYSVSSSGVHILRDDIDMDDAVILRLAYAYDNANHYVVDFFRKKMGYKTLFFKGTNYDSSEGALFDAIFNKVLFGPLSQFDLITGDGFLTLTLTGAVEKDSGSWFKLTKQES